MHHCCALLFVGLALLCPPTRGSATAGRKHAVLAHTPVVAKVLSPVEKAEQLKWEMDNGYQNRDKDVHPEETKKDKDETSTLEVSTQARATTRVKARAMTKLEAQATAKAKAKWGWRRRWWWCGRGLYFDWRHRYCRDRNECRWRPCDRLISCRNTWRSYYCTPCPKGMYKRRNRCYPRINCPRGFYRNHNKGTCEDRNECLRRGRRRVCDPKTKCTNTVGSYTCGACETGYTKMGRRCRDINECNANNGNCDPKTKCKNTPGSYICTACPNGWKGNSMIACEDVDECSWDKTPCNHGRKCTNIPGSFKCGACPKGLQESGPTDCTDIDECDKHNGGCDPLTECKNQWGKAPKCGRCPRGYKGSGEMGCQDINECGEENGDCPAGVVCINTDGANQCGHCDFTLIEERLSGGKVNCTEPESNAPDMEKLIGLTVRKTNRRIDTMLRKKNQDWKDELADSIRVFNDEKDARTIGSRVNDLMKKQEERHNQNLQKSTELYDDAAHFIKEDAEFDVKRIFRDTKHGHAISSDEWKQASEGMDLKHVKSQYPRSYEIMAQKDLIEKAEKEAAEKEAAAKKAAESDSTEEPPPSPLTRNET